MPELPHISDAELLTGRTAEFGELLEVLAERQGASVVISDPWSGTSALLAAATKQSEVDFLLVDARPCLDGLDLAMAIADAAVARFAPGSRAWWTGMAPPSSTEGLTLWRHLRADAIDIDGLRDGSPPGDERLREALEVLVTISGDSCVLIIDHLGSMLSGMRPAPARELLDVLRAARQRHPSLDLVLVDHPAGPIASSLTDPSHPLYQGARPVRLRRPTPDRITGDLAITRPTTNVRVGLLRTAAELAHGVPELTWRIVELAPATGEDVARATIGWSVLRRVTEGSVRREWDLLRRLHNAAQPVVSAISVGLRPNNALPASKSIDDALKRLRETGLAWQPAERTWAVTDPLLAAWARDHPPAWALRRSGVARGGSQGRQ